MGDMGDRIVEDVVQSQGRCDRIQIGRLIRSARHARGWTQQQLAVALAAASGNDSIGRAEVARWERGKRIPGVYWQGWISAVLEVPPNDLHAAAQRARDLRSRR
jgi:transcriptional regulator with XRE-family HTH domain